MSPTEQLQELLAAIDGAFSVVVASHLNPDGDAIGSTLATADWCRARGKATMMLNNNPAPDYLHFLAGATAIQNESPERTFDLGIALDLESSERLGRHRELFESLPHVVTIDHHVPHQSFGDLRIIDPASAATCAILTELLLASGDDITPEMAQALLTGIVTDTGSFRFPNTTPRTLELAGMLVEKGGDLAQIAEEVFARRPLAKVKLVGWALDHMRLSDDQRLAWAAIPRHVFGELDAEEQHTEGIVNELLGIRTVDAAALLRDNGTKVKASLRSRGSIDVSKVAQDLGGGGHRNAAGVSFDCSLEEAEERTVEALKACLASS